VHLQELYQRYGYRNTDYRLNQGDGIFSMHLRAFGRLELIRAFGRLELNALISRF
jgi:hypothetical protein